MQQYACTTCHLIPGLVGSRVYVGPPLTGIARRRYLAGTLPNSPENMVRWIQKPKSISPETLMPDLSVGDEHARDIAAYLPLTDRMRARSMVREAGVARARWWSRPRCCWRVRRSLEPAEWQPAMPRRARGARTPSVRRLPRYPRRRSGHRCRRSAAYRLFAAGLHCGQTAPGCGSARTLDQGRPFARATDRDACIGVTDTEARDIVAYLYRLE